MENINKMIKTFIKNWTLPIAIIVGALSYILYSHLSILDFSRPYASKIIAVFQPLLIFSMLFLSFCKIDIRTLRLHASHLWMLLIQCGIFTMGCLILHFFYGGIGNVWIEAAILCMICPTATAASVVTQKLHGDAADITMYTLLINLSVAILIPALTPLAHPQSDQAFIDSFIKIMLQVFPLLICPLIIAQLVKSYCSRIHRWFLSFHDLAFYLWAVALSIAIAITVRSLVHTHHSMWEVFGIAVVSLVCCIVQFSLGRIIGEKFGTPISSCQGLGQKNTVFAIWMGYTFLNPITSIAGGFYSIWHNLYNTYQLRKVAKESN